tara:strand:+ start:242 stop:523 length:282 start_codon:yes stop_codon:yes gene_type:complete
MSFNYSKAYADLHEAIKAGGLTAVKASKNMRESRQGLMSSNSSKVEEMVEDDSSDDIRVLRKFNDVKESNERLIERIKAEIEVEDEGDKDEDN